MKNKIVYVVTDGVYSDYHIEDIFSSLALAKKYCAIHGICEDSITEWEIDENKKEIRNALVEYIVHISPKGNINEVSTKGYIPKKGWKNCTVKARNAAHAKKIVQDKYAEELYKLKMGE